jgi:hypothetical protein
LGITPSSVVKIAEISNKEIASIFRTEQNADEENDKVSINTVLVGFIFLHLNL